MPRRKSVPAADVRRPSIVQLRAIMTFIVRPDGRNPCFNDAYREIGNTCGKTSMWAKQRSSYNDAVQTIERLMNGGTLNGRI